MTKFLSYWHSVYAQSRIWPRKWDAWNSVGLWDIKGSHYPGQKTRRSVNKQEERNLSFSGFCYFTEPLSKNKRRLKKKKIDKYWNLVRELRRTWNMKQLVIAFVVGSVAMAIQRPEKETMGIGDQKKNRQHSNHSTVKISECWSEETYSNSSENRLFKVVQKIRVEWK